MLHRCALAVVMLFVCSAAFAATQGGPIPVPLPLFPQNNWWNLDISSAPPALNSDDFIDFINALSNASGRQLHPDFGGDAGDGNVYGIPFTIVDGNQAKLTVDFMLYGDQSDGWDPQTEESFPFYPVPSEAITMNGWVEGGQPGTVDERDDADRHLLIVDKDNNYLYELYNVWYNGTRWEAGSGAFFDMNVNGRRPEGWTSADAAGLAILPGLVRYDEVYGPDEIRHAFRVTVRDTNSYVWPASHDAGDNPSALPMGARLRLKADKNISGYPAEIQKIFRAMKKYGLIVADNGSDMYIGGEYDPRWDNDILNPAFHSLHAQDFEVVQLGWQPAVTFVLSLPSAVGAGDATTATLTVYNSDDEVATGYTGTVHFTSTDGAATLPLDYTFTLGDAGVHTFTNGLILRTPGSQVVTFQDVAVASNTGSVGVTVGPPTPIGLVATATSTTTVSVTWSPSTGATQYEVRRGTGTPFVTASTSYNDTTAVAGTSYLYTVRAVDSLSRRSAYSAPDVATTVLFTDEPLVAGSTTVKIAHMTQLRQAVNAMRTAAGLSAATFTDPVLTNVNIKAVHVSELRTALNAARSTLGLSALAYTDAALVAGTTRVKAAHVQELRNGVK